MAVNFGQIERPVLAPHLEYRCIGDGQTLLVSETFNTLLHGQVYEDLLPLLDGRRSRESIFDALEGAHQETDVRKALAFLESRGYIVSGDHGMERGKAAFWSSQGVSPRRVEERLQEAMVVIHGDDGSLADPCLRPWVLQSVQTVRPCPYTQVPTTLMMSLPPSTVSTWNRPRHGRWSGLQGSNLFSVPCFGPRRKAHAGPALLTGYEITRRSIPLCGTTAARRRRFVRT